MLAIGAVSNAPDGELLAAARGGDRRSFDGLAAASRRPLLAHCYRMLGSTTDADDAVQEALVRAWRHLPAFEGRSSFRTWLFSIATRVCLDLAERRGARRLPSLDDAPPADPSLPPGAPIVDPVWIEPLPDAAWCDGDPDGAESPEASCTRRQSVAVAFLAAIQMLPASQRAALLLHDVAGWPAAEIADALDTSAPAVHSALQRARATLDARAPQWNRRAPRADAADTDALGRYLRAWNTGDPGVLAAVLRDDAVLAMPPMSAWYRGRDAFVGFFEGFVLRLGMSFRLVVAPSTNGQPAIASYRSDPATPGVFHADALHVLTLDERGAIAAVMVFLGPAAVQAHGLPTTQTE